MLRLSASVVALALGAQGAPPTMPVEYTAVIMVRMPYIPLEMPMRLVTSATSQRNEYYDGLLVDSITPEGIYQYTFNNSKRICMFQAPSSGPQEQLKATAGFSPVKFLPDLAQYMQEADELVGGTMCNKFTLSAKHGTTGSMDDHMSFYWDPLLGKPVRWHMHSRAVPFGSHTDEYFIDYLSFHAGTPAAADLALPKLCAERPKAAKFSLKMGNFLKATTMLHSETPKVFEAFLKQHGKAYAPEEHTTRKELFTKNMLLVEKLNQKHAGKATFKANQFTDMTKEEIMTFRGGKNKGQRTAEHQKFVRMHEKTAAEPPTNFDWRTEKPGVVGPVKDQAMCGSCWTYGTIGPIESIMAIRTGKLVTLPEQYVLDCTWTNNTGDSGTNSGCDGGDSDIGALEVVRKFGGIVPTASSYGPYMAVNGYCKDISLMEVGAKITGWVDIKDRDEAAVMHAVATVAPLSVGIQVPDEMLYYDTGVLDVDSCKHNESTIDHAVVIVGYGTEAGKDYYLIRNSWSTYWGDEGYIKIARGDNDCCVSCQAGYPSVADSTVSSVIV